MVVHRKRRGAGILSDLVSSVGLGRKRRGMRRGRGFLDGLKSVGNFLKDQVAPIALPIAGALVKRRLGLGRRRKRRVGGMRMKRVIKM